MSTLQVKRKQYEIIKKTRDLHNFSEALVSFKNVKYIAKQYDLISIMLDDIKCRSRLKKYGINVPKYKVIDKKNNITLEEYIEGDNALTQLVKGELPDGFYKELYNQYRFCRFSKIELNYMPENFILSRKKMYYTSFDYGPAKEATNLENYGIYYWFYSNEFYNHLQELGIDFDKRKILKPAEVKKKIVLLSIMNW